MTKRLYYDQTYLTDFDAAVLECRENGGTWLVRLDQSAFYPTSGGQPYDMGTLGTARILNVEVTDGEVWHTVDTPLEEGTSVHGRIDWARRFDHMQQHAADHMIAGALHRHMGGVTIGLHISEEVSTIDVAMPEGVTRISEEAIRSIETDVNEHIQRDVPIRCWFPSEEELAVLPLRKKPTVSEHVRIVAIGDDEMVACGGTHPSTAGQIGIVKILGVAPARGKMRVSFIAGMRALKDYCFCYDAAHASAECFSTGVEHLEESIRALQERLSGAEAELSRLRMKKAMDEIAAALHKAQPLENGVRVAALIFDADVNAVREAASKAIREEKTILLLGARNGESIQYVFARSADGTIHAGQLLKQAAQAVGGKGGGRPDFAQGSGPKEMLEAALQLLREEN